MDTSHGSIEAKRGTKCLGPVLGALAWVPSDRAQVPYTRALVHQDWDRDPNTHAQSLMIKLGFLVPKPNSTKVGPETPGGHVRVPGIPARNYCACA